MSETTPYHRLWLLSGQLMHAAGVGMWCYTAEGESLHYTTCPQEDEMRVFLELSGCPDYLRDNWPFRRPVLLTDNIGIMWVMEHYINAEGGAEFSVIIGPMFTSDRSAADVDRSLKEMDLSIETKLRMLRITEKIPVVTRSIVKQYAIMLHYAMTEDGIRPEDLVYRDNSEDILPRVSETSDEKYSERVDEMRAAKSEEMLLRAVREGSDDYLKIAEEESIVNGGQLVIDTGDHLRDARMSMIIFCALVSRAAIKGGAVIYTAKETEKRYLEDISKCRSVDKLVKIKSMLLAEFIGLVRKAKSSEELSREVRSCCDFIKANVTSELSVELLAKKYGYTEYYFTKKFYKEVGVRLGDYIKDARIDYAKILLLTTSRSIDDISFDLQFSNRNYFSKVFHEKVGMTPVAYRAKAGIFTGENK